MLMITVMAFATDYTDQLKYEIAVGSNYYPVENAKGTLSITQYDNGNYQVTAKNCDFSSNPDVGSSIGNLGDLICDALSGTTDGNGVTTIDVTDCTAGLDGSTWIDMSSTKLLVKFKGDKAYATFTGKYRMSVFPYQWRTVSYTFGTDEGFDGGSTGGGETGGEDKPAIVTVAENFVAKGESLGWEFDINWDTQKVVMSIDPSTCGTGTDHIIGLGSNPLQFRNNLHLYRSSSDKMLQGYCYYNIDNNTHKFSETNPILIEISKEKGFVVNGIAKIVPSTMGTFFSLTHLKMDTGEGSNNKSRATYNYVKVVPLDWKEVPPVTVDKTFTYDKDAYVGPNDLKGTANVKVNKMTDGSYTMEITAPVATKVGEITVSKDEKGRTLYMGEAESTVVSGLKYIVHGVVYTAEDGTEHLYMTLTHDDDTYFIGENPDAPKVVATVPFTGVAFTVSNGMSGNADVTFTEMSDGNVKMAFVGGGYTINLEGLAKGADAKSRTTYTGKVSNGTNTYTVNAVVYGEATAQKLYMTMVAADGTTFTVGENPDRAAYKNTLYVVENAKLLVETADAEVVLLDKGDNKYDVTLPAFTAGEMTVPSITFEATKADNKLTASNVSVPDVYSGEAAVVTMDGTFESDKLFASLTVKCGKWFDYEVGYGIKPFVATTKEYTADWANVKVGDAEPVNFQNAKADYTEFAKDQYSLTFKDLTFGEKKIGDFTIKYVKEDADGKLSTTASAGEWTRVEAGQDVASKGDMPAISGFEGVIGGTGVLKVKFTIAVGGTTGNVAVDFGRKYEAPIEGTVVEQSKDFAAKGSKFEWSNIAIDWNKQKLVAVIDLSSCKGTSENILSVGQNIGDWKIGGWHFYYTVASKKMKSDYLATGGAHPVSDPKTGVEPGTVRIELSKAEGCTIDGVSYNALYDSNVTGTWQSNTEDFWKLTSVNIGSKEGLNRSNAVIKYVTVVDLPVTVKETKEFNEALYMVQGTTSSKVADAKVVVKEMSDNTINMSLSFSGNEYTSTELTKGADAKNRTTYTGKLSNGSQTYDVAGVVYEKDNAERLYMTMETGVATVVVGENPDAVTPDPEVTEVSNKTYTSNLKMTEGEEDVVEMPEAKVNIIKYSDESYKVTLKDVNILKKTQDLVFVGKALAAEEAPTAELLTIKAKSDEATTQVFGEQMNATFEITEVSAEEIKMGFSMESDNFSYEGKFNYTDEEVDEPEVYTSNLHIYDTTAPETDLFQADQAKVEFLATEAGEFKLTLKDVTLNEKTQDLVFTGTLPTPGVGGQEELAEEGEGEVTPADPEMVLNAIADEATTLFLGGGATFATAVFNVSYDKNDNFMMTFTITAVEKTLGGEFNYEKKDPDTPDTELFCKENYVADGNGFEWDINVDWDTQKIVMSIDPSTCTGTCEHIIGLGATPTVFHGNLHLYRTNDQQLQGYFETSAGNNNTGKFDETAPFLVEVSKAQGFVVNNEVKIAASAMSDLFTLSTVKMGTGEGTNDKSRATYNYVKVVDKDWTAPKDPDTGINATTVAEGEVEFFTVNGVKLNKLQKGLNIVRSADGKVKKVLVK